MEKFYKTTVKPSTMDSTALLKLGYKNYQELYLDWINNFISSKRFAEYHNIDKVVAEKLISNAVYLYN